MLYRFLPGNAMTWLAGHFARADVPVPLRRPLYGLYALLFGCRLDEAALPLEAFPTFNAFFTRALRTGARPVDRQADLVSPVDGQVVALGRIDVPFATAQDGQLLVFPEQIKGISYQLKAFVTDTAFARLVQPHRSDPLYYATIYLAPGDYHRIHSPTRWRQAEPPARISGQVLSVAPYMMRWVRSLLCLNERVVLHGRWRHGAFAMVPVGATNVRSIRLEDRTAYEAGDPVAVFEMGSTVVLLFRAPPTFQWAAQAGEQIAMGRPLGTVPRTYWLVNGVV